MKNFILCVALVGCALACKADKNAAISDPSSANMPKSECATKPGCCAEKPECAGQKADCQKVCPMTKPQG